VLVWLIAGWRPTEGLQQWELLSSVSAYYYTGAVAAFVGILVALAVFLFTYRGYNNEYSRRDRIAAITAGASAAIVAFFPTSAPGDVPEPSWWTQRTGTIHYISAAVLFGAFIFFCLFLFPKSKVKEGEALPRDKRVRNHIYISCGAAMLVCILWAGSASFTGAPIFWPEALALEFFAVSWLVKGRADRTLATAGRRTLNHGSNAMQSLSRAWSSIRN
jgi:phosphoglycerol transferase MdoB-like AlkP superfamily enzyme